ncbi:MAG: FeoA family protein [Erysipelotrichaceae bacterium]|nr:FeoA family protein [Erysipelotrichaceae bacterium]
MTLDKLKIGESAQITAINGKGVLRHRLLEMGLTPRTKVYMRNMAPMGDPIEIMLRGYTLTLRKAEASNIDIEAIHE